MSIKHFHALSEKRKRIFVDHPHEFSVKEKVDGSNLLFGAKDGKLWTARKNENEKFFEADEWPNQMWAQNFKLAHLGLEGSFNSLCETAGLNWTARAELVCTLYPNTILYSSPLSYILVFDGPNFNTTYSSVRAQVQTSANGKDPHHENQEIEYCLQSMPYESIDLFQITEVMKEMVDPIERSAYLVERLCNDYVTSRYDCNVRPEGYVVTHIDGWSFKVVDTTWFTALNTQNYAFRKQLFKTPQQKTDSVMDVYTRHLTAGVDSQQAKANAILRLDAIRESYFQGEMNGVSNHIHRRNIESLASLYQQLTSSTWAAKHSTT